ncbi:hypothetical protein HJFPF1_02180 [Paramyrothecium foliicola]|nr:hypothetical protein HJFPF1_02180 [Paramyrothecium foliicola]
MVRITLLTAAMAAAPIAALPGSELFARVPCNRDNCFRAVIASSSRLADCSSFMAATVTPCTSTVTNTATVTSTTTVNTFPLKRDAIAAPSDVALEARQQEACAFTTNSATAPPAFATIACVAGATAVSARFSSACSCNGITGATTTLETPTVTVTSTSTLVVTAQATPSAFVLQATGDRSLYVSVDEAGALRLTRDESAALPVYVDNSGQLRSLQHPDRLFVDYYEPSPGTADNKVYNHVPSEANYRLTCNYYGRNDGDFWGQCNASGPPNGNPVVYGFGTCPNQGYYVYMIPNNSNVRCWDGGYAFLGFYLKAYTSK